jgi:hypothetical protein
MQGHDQGHELRRLQQQTTAARNYGNKFPPTTADLIVCGVLFLQR